MEYWILLSNIGQQCIVSHGQGRALCISTIEYYSDVITFACIFHGCCWFSMSWSLLVTQLSWMFQKNVFITTLASVFAQTIYWSYGHGDMWSEQNKQELSLSYSNIWTPSARSPQTLSSVSFLCFKSNYFGLTNLSVWKGRRAPNGHLSAGGRSPKREEAPNGQKPQMGKAPNGKSPKWEEPPDGRTTIVNHPHLESTGCHIEDHSAFLCGAVKHSLCP